MATQTAEGLDKAIREVATQLYEIGIITHGHSNQPEHRNALNQKVVDFTKLLQTISHDATETLKGLPAQLPYTPGERTGQQENVAATGSTFITPDIVEYIDQGRNPSIYTREFVEATSQLNLHMKGKQDAFTGFRDVLVKEIGARMPDLKEDLEMIVRTTNLPG